MGKNEITVKPVTNSITGPKGNTGVVPLSCHFKKKAARGRTDCLRGREVTRLKPQEMMQFL